MDGDDGGRERKRAEPALVDFRYPNGPVCLLVVFWSLFKLIRCKGEKGRDERPGERSSRDVIMSSKRRVAYFYDAEIGNYHYGQGHPMKVRHYSPWMIVVASS